MKEASSSCCRQESGEQAKPFSSRRAAQRRIRSRAISFILVLVRSLIRFHAPVPSLFILGGTPSLPRYLDSLCRACMEQNMMSSPAQTSFIISCGLPATSVRTSPPNRPTPWSICTMQSPASIWPSSFSDRASLPPRARSERRLYLWKRSKIWWSVKKQRRDAWSVNPSCSVRATGVNGMLSPRSAKMAFRRSHCAAESESIYRLQPLSISCVNDFEIMSKFLW